MKTVKKYVFLLVVFLLVTCGGMDRVKAETDEVFSIYIPLALSEPKGWVPVLHGNVTGINYLSMSMETPPCEEIANYKGYIVEMLGSTGWKEFESSIREEPRNVCGLLGIGGGNTPVDLGQYRFRARWQKQDGSWTAWSEEISIEVWWQYQSNNLAVSGPVSGGEARVWIKETPPPDYCSRIWIAPAGGSVITAPPGAVFYEPQDPTAWYWHIQPGQSPEVYLNWEKTGSGYGGLWLGAASTPYCERLSDEFKRNWAGFILWP